MKIVNTRNYSLEEGNSWAGFLTKLGAQQNEDLEQRFTAPQGLSLPPLGERLGFVSTFLC